MMNIQIPSSDFGNTHVMATEFGGLYVPHDVLAIGVLVADFDHSCGNSVHPLPAGREFSNYESVIYSC